MCHHCDYAELFREKGIRQTPNRLGVMEIAGSSAYPLSAQEIFDTLIRTKQVNRVTVYRVLELLVKKELLERISAGDRQFRYGMAPNANHLHHPHFYCKRCNGMECLSPESIFIGTESLERTFPGSIEKVEVRIDGICRNCLRKSRSGASFRDS